ncbi:MAG: GAF domain-containing protein, partial [Victivallaceae bacterium]|nr:GAF domain-containing protein [Victivallaceae bacterium]
MKCPLNCTSAMDETCILTEAYRTQAPVKHATMIGNRCFVIRANPIADATGETVFFVKSYTDISEQTERIQQENVLNRCLETFFLEPDLMTGMQTVSMEICSYMEASRLFIMKFDTKAHTADHYFEYSDNGSKFFSVVKDWHFDPDEHWFRLFLERQAVLLDDVNAPGADETLRSWTDFFQKSTTRSIYVAPIFVDGELWGDFGIAYERKTKTQPELRKNVLKHATRLFGELLSREQMRQQVLGSLRKAQQ